MSADSIRILHTNDLHGALDRRRFEVLKRVRRDCDLYFDSGDCIRTGNLGIPLRPEPVWPMLFDLECTASVPGYRESHVMRSVFESKLAGRQHPILCANLYDKVGKRILSPSMTVESKGVKIGVLGVMVPMVTERMKSQSISQMIWTPPIPEAIDAARSLRQTCDLVIALTHIGVKQDRALAEATEDIDLILGGHSHTLLDPPEKAGCTWICQEGAHGRFYGRYEWRPDTRALVSEVVPWLPDNS